MLEIQKQAHTLSASMYDQIHRPKLARYHLVTIIELASFELNSRCPNRPLRDPKEATNSIERDLINVAIEVPVGEG